MFIALGILAVIILYSVYGGSPAVNPTIDTAVGNYIPLPIKNPVTDPYKFPDGLPTPPPVKTDFVPYYKEQEINPVSEAQKDFAEANPYVAAPVSVWSPDPVSEAQKDFAEANPYVAAPVYQEPEIAMSFGDIYVPGGYFPPPENNPVPASNYTPVTPEPTTIPDSVSIKDVSYTPSKVFVAHRSARNEKIFQSYL